MEDYYPETPAFLGAFRNSYIMDLSEKMVDTKPGDVILDTEITMKMMLMEFWQDSIKNEAGLVFMLDGQKVCGADAYASMAWGKDSHRLLVLKARHPITMQVTLLS